MVSLVGIPQSIFLYGIVFIVSLLKLNLKKDLFSFENIIRCITVFVAKGFTKFSSGTDSDHQILYWVCLFSSLSGLCASSFTLGAFQ